MAPPLPFATVVIPSRDEERSIRACLDGVLAQDYPAERFEVLVVDGESRDRTRQIVAEVADRSDGRIRLLDNPARTTPAALNRALREARGEYLVRVDAHSVPVPHYLRALVEGNLELGAELVGGWVEAAGSNSVGDAVAAAFRSPFSMGNPISWNRPSGPIEVASVPCGSYSVESLRAIGGFDEGQHANQDYEANYRLRRAGGRVFMVPHVSFRYFPRDTFRGLARQFARYGFYKARTMAKHPASVRPRHLVPAAALVVFVLLLVAGVFWAPARLLVGASLALYALLLVAASLAAARGNLRTLVLLPAVFATMHVTWGAGNLAGLARFWPRRRELR